MRDAIRHEHADHQRIGGIARKFGRVVSKVMVPKRHGLSHRYRLALDCGGLYWYGNTDPRLGDVSGESLR